MVVRLILVVNGVFGGEDLGEHERKRRRDESRTDALFRFLFPRAEHQSPQSLR